FLSELAALAPNDASVKRLRAEVEAQRMAQVEAAARAEEAARAEAVARAETERLAKEQAAAQQAAAVQRAAAAAQRGFSSVAAPPANPLTQKLVADLKKEKASALLAKAQVLIKQGDTDGARVALDVHDQLAPADPRAASVARQLANAEAKSVATAASPTFTA